MPNHGNRKSRRRQLRASHQKNWLTGRYAVVETLRARKWPVSDLFIADDISDGDEIEQLLAEQDLRIQRVTSERLAELCHSTHHQGLAARLGEFPYDTVETLIDAIAAAQDVKPLVVICDRIQDSHNFGAILRSCDAMNATAVLVGDSEQAIVTPQVSRSSSGAVNHVSIVQCSELAVEVEKLKAAGLTIAVASEQADSNLWAGTLNCPVGLIVGSEARGVSQQLIAASNCMLKVPMMGHVSSLNAAVAAGIMLYEIRRQQMA